MEEISNDIPTNVDMRAVTPYAELTSMRHIVEKIQSDNIWPAIEVIYNDRDSLYIGSVLCVHGRSFRMNCYNAAGEFEKEYELDFDEVFKIEIESKYTSHFSGFVKRMIEGIKRM